MSDRIAERAAAGFWVASREWNADRIAAEVGLVPDERRDKHPGAPANYTNLAVYRSPLPKSAKIADHLAAVVSRMAPARARLGELVRSRDVGACLRVSVVTGRPFVDFALSPAQLAFLADAGATFHFRTTSSEILASLRERSRREGEERRGEAASADTHG